MVQRRTQRKPRVLSGDTRQVKIRHFLITNPQGTFDDFTAAVSDLPAKPKMVKQLYYRGKGQLAKRYGIPYENVAGLTPAKLARLTLLKFPKWGYEEVSTYLAQDGVEIERSTFDFAKRELKKVVLLGTSTMPASNGESLDPNQTTGPRKRKPGKERRKRKLSITNGEENSVATTYLSLEGELDKLIKLADNLRDGKLAESLRVSRRIAGAKVLQNS